MTTQQIILKILVNYIWLLNTDITGYWYSGNFLVQRKLSIKSWYCCEDGMLLLLLEWQCNFAVGSESQWWGFLLSCCTVSLDTANENMAPASWFSLPSNCALTSTFFPASLLTVPTGVLLIGLKVLHLPDRNFTGSQIISFRMMGRFPDFKLLDSNNALIVTHADITVALLEKEKCNSKYFLLKSNQKCFGTQPLFIFMWKHKAKVPDSRYESACLFSQRFSVNILPLSSPERDRWTVLWVCRLHKCETRSVTWPCGN